jgi:putative ABC transport system permease protein
MSAWHVIKTASGGVTRRRTQTLVVFIVLLVSTAAATLGMALLANSSGPFDHAFASRHGAHVAVVVDSARVTDAQLVATARQSDVTNAAGPFPLASARLEVKLEPPPRSAQTGPPPPNMAWVDTMNAVVIGRASPGGSVDDLTLTAGRWAERPGEIVLSSSTPQSGNTISAPLGTFVTVTSAPGRPRLTLVGYADSITDTASAWVVPTQAAALRPPNETPSAQMLYRFASAGSDRQIRADVAAVSAALPAGAISGTASWLAARDQAKGTSSIIAPFVVAFALIAIVMSVLIIVNVISGAVVASYRRIGVLKSIGFTPAQVVAAYLARVGVPALVGCALGVVLGNLLAVPVLQKSASAYAVGGQAVPVWVNIAAPLLMCTLVGFAALAPALRAGRLSAIQAIATGHAPRHGRGYAAHRLASRLRLPRPVGIGLAAPFAKPARTAFTFAAVTFGAVAIIFAVGLDTSLARAAEGQTHAEAEQVQVQGGPATASQEHAVAAALRAQPATRRYVAEAMPTISVSGLTRPVPAEAFLGDAAWIGYDVIHGAWYRGSGEADVNTAFLAQSGLSVGDSTTITAGAKPVRVRIVGEVFDPQGNDQPALLTSWQTLGGTHAGLQIAQYDVGLKPGTNPDSYSTAVNQALGPNTPFNASAPSGGQFYSVAESLIAILTLMIAIVAGLGVLSTVLLGTRERVHDLAVFKAIGMTPRQTIVMVVCWVTVPALAAAAIAIPIATILHSATARAMGAAAFTGIPAVVMDVYKPTEVVLLALSGLAIAVVGALLPANWAARSRTATALRSE